MAKRENSSTQNKSTEEQKQASATDNKEVREHLTDEQKQALEVEEKAAEGKSVSGKYKLKDQKTSYQDRDFTLAGDQEKELPEDPSPELIQRIASGFIVKA
jgi:hypothetical protein